MKILSAAQIKEWDEYTIQHEPVTSVNLMERAAQQCANWIIKSHKKHYTYKIFCGKGNNGGDGLAIARLLAAENFDVAVYILEFGKIGSLDFQENLQRLNSINIEKHYLQSEELFPVINKSDVVIDAIFGAGLNKPPEGLVAALIEYINANSKKTVSIDVPSGMYLDKSSKGNTIIKANNTLSFELLKLNFLIPENSNYLGKVLILKISLKKYYLKSVKSDKFLTTPAYIKRFFKSRERFSHKGTFGHSLLIGGSYGKIGAVVLAVNACSKSGSGLTSVFIPKCGYNILQTALPEVMTITDENENYITNLPEEIQKFSAIGIGPGLGTVLETQKVLLNLIKLFQKRLLLDADALNCLALNKDALNYLPQNTILTPHPKEFARLFGESENDFEQMFKAQEAAIQFKIIIVLKGHHTIIALPNGKLYFNTTGNAGMAKGGSGDVLTGIITALLSNGYQPNTAAILGVYIHGMAGDKAAKAKSKEAMLPTDLINYLSETFLAINRWQHDD